MLRAIRLTAAVLTGLGLLLVLGACSDDVQPSAVSWRNITFEMPDDWYVFEETETRLSISNADIGPRAAAALEEGADAPDGDVVAMFLTFEPSSGPADWRAYAEAQDATIEVDESIQLGDGVPATRLVIDYVTDGVPLREMIVIIPSRGVVALAQPVPFVGQEDGPEIFLDYRETFDEVLETARFGPPLMD